jgi:hypothetical protein
MTGAKAAPNRPDVAGKTARGRNVRSRDAAHNRKTSPSARRYHAAFTIHPTYGKPFEIVVTGRVPWALVQLVTPGGIGCTPVQHPVSRWSGYIFHLRQLGEEIETLTQNHGGDFPGHHGRYVLRCKVTRKGGGE